MKYIQKIFTGIKKHFIKIVVFVLFIFFIPSLFILGNSFGKISGSKGMKILSYPNIEEEVSSLSNINNSDKKVAIVFGAAARGGYPSDIYADRLRVAAELYFQQKIQKILISGDNRVDDYNEPQAGKSFLQAKGVPESDIILDYAGLRTHDTCVRAKKIFGVNEAYLVTQEFHLPRALFLCEHFGIQSHGVSASLQGYRGTLTNLIRESLAHQKAFYEVYFFPHDPKHLGKKEFIFEN